MSYLRFEKTLMTNLQEALPKEILRTNRSGAYSSSSILDCNTRKHHGLLVVPVPQIDGENYVLLSSLDETVLQHGAEFNLGLHRYSGGIYSPNGHKYAREFSWEKVPTTIYRVGGVILKKEKVFQHFHNRVLIRYTLLDAHSITTLRLRPFLAYRRADQLTHENSAAWRGREDIENGICTCMYEGYPGLFMQASKKPKYVHIPDWYKGIEYQYDMEMGYDYKEDLYVPGYFEFDIKKGESIIFSAGLEAVDTDSLHSTFDKEVEVHKPRENFIQCLTNAAHQFHNKHDNQHYIIAGYPWFKSRARDTFLSLPGLTLAIGEVENFRKAMDTAIIALNDLMEGREISVDIQEMHDPDIPLWAVWCIQQYARLYNRQEAMELYGDLVCRIVQFIMDGKHPNLHLRENGLLYTDGTTKPVTWMNSMVNGMPAVPRTGFIVEINALWYNALKFNAQILESKGNSETAMQCDTWAELAGESFRDTFLNEYGYLLDYVDGNNISWAVRPNMLIAVSLENTPLSIAERKKIFDICTKELRTPKGIRSLSPKSGGYNPIYKGNQQQRDAAYHQGTVWPWLLGFYIETNLKIYKQSGLSFADRCLVGLEGEMSCHSLGTLSELFDGNPPFEGRGAYSFAMNVAAILRVNKIMSKYYNY